MTRPPLLGPLMDALADQIRDALEDVVEAIQVEPRMVIAPTPPCIDIYPADPFQAPLAFGIGQNEINLTVRARVNTPDDVAAQDLLLSFMDPFSDTSLLRAVMLDDTLDGAAETLTVEEGPSNFGLFPDASGTASFLGCTWTVKIYAVEPTVIGLVGYGAGGYGSEPYGG